ncbi:protein kinase, partial [Microtetraspora sp. AC03309]|uniref:protein kinase domain-containing protein n=1 Tax=Microtetraspora sp. AC03309 TaxID=2779376 RepID=UPI001E5207A7
MPAIGPLRPEDPERLGDYRLRGRLSADARSVVYAAESSSGQQVAVTLYSLEPDSPDEFLRRVEALEGLPVSGAVRVLDAGTANRLPYVVTELVDGPTLARTVREHGPLTGPALHRLAVGTVTVLVAIHQAGAVHGEFEPGAVVLGPDGPRVAGTGVAAVLHAAPDGVTQPVTSPSYLAPERLAGEGAGPPADMFAWASAMVFAASGHSPFDADGTAATMNRVLTGEPDLPDLDEPLGPLIAACLARDPVARPTAGDALLRLVGHSLLTGRHETAVPDLPPPAA